MVSQTGCAMVMGKMAKFMGERSAETTTKLSDVNLTALMSTHIMEDIGTPASAIFPDYKGGGDMLAILFGKKTGNGYYKVDGTVTVDGKPIEYTSIYYSAFSDSNAKPRKVEITMRTGEKESFTIEPSDKHIKLVSINGQKAKPSLDLTKDVVLEIDAPSVPAGTLMKVSIAIKQLSIKGIYAVCNVRYTPGKINVPASAFRNIDIKPAGNLLFSFDDSYLSVDVDSLEQAKDVSGPIPSVQYIASTGDGMAINVTAEPKLNPGLAIKGTLANMDYNVFKADAYLSRPLEQVKKFGLLSFAIRGTTFHQEVKEFSSTSSQTYGGVKTTNTSHETQIKTLKFPQQTDKTWDTLMEDLYPDFMAVLKTELQATELPIEKVTNTDAYKASLPFANDDTNTSLEFARSFRDTKVISARMPVGEGFNENSLSQKVLEQAGADALFTLTLDLQISERSSDKAVLMTPKLAFELAGAPNGSGIRRTTKFFAGTIDSTEGVPFTKNIDLPQLRQIVRKPDLLAAFRKALQDLKEREKEDRDYTEVWALQK